MDVRTPTLGDIVLYRSKHGPYLAPAVVVRTRESTIGNRLKPLGPTDVDLSVLTSGGSFIEHAVPHGDGSGQWQWRS